MKNITNVTQTTLPLKRVTGRTALDDNVSYRVVLKSDKMKYYKDNNTDDQSCTRFKRIANANRGT